MADFIAYDHRYPEGSSYPGDTRNSSRIGTGPDEVQAFGETGKLTGFHHPAIRRFAAAGREPEQVPDPNPGSRQ